MGSVFVGGRGVMSLACICGLWLSELFANTCMHAYLVDDVTLVIIHIATSGQSIVYPINQPTKQTHSRAL